VGANLKRRRLKRDLAFWCAGALIGVLLITPAGAHVGGTVAHLWGHLKPKVTALVYTKAQSDTKFLGKAQTAADADKLDGRDSTEFLAPAEKAADSDMLDGLDSSVFATKAEATNIIGPGGPIDFNTGFDGTAHGAWCNWTTYDSAHASPGYYKDSAGAVHLQGRVTATSGSVSICGDHAEDYTMFTLPEGYRPAKKRVFAVVEGSYIGRVNIEPDGDVRYESLNSNWNLQLDGINFRAHPHP
jgi:hypothetical protein